MLGGEGSWRQYLTIPNILKEFNPNLVGYSWRSSITIERASQFNVAEGGAVSEDMPYMSSVLIKRIKNDPRVDLKKHWKVSVLKLVAYDRLSIINSYYSSL